MLKDMKLHGLKEVEDKSIKKIKLYIEQRDLRV